MTYTRLKIKSKQEKDRELPRYVQVKRPPHDAERKLYSAEYPGAVLSRKATVVKEEKAEPEAASNRLSDKEEICGKALAAPGLEEDTEQGAGGFLRKPVLAVSAIIICFFAVHFSGVTAPDYVKLAFSSSCDFLSEKYITVFENFGESRASAKGKTEDNPANAHEFSDFEIIENTNAEGSYFADLVLRQEESGGAQAAVSEDEAGEALIVSRNLSPGAQSVFSHNETALSLDLDYLATAAYPIPAYDGIEDDPLVLILHTHGTECYSDSTSDGAVRSTDTERNVVRVGRELASVLNSFGIPTLHSTTMHDQASYITAYSSSRAEAERLLALHPTIKYVIDLHRDAIPNENASRVKPCVEILGEDTAQIMLVIGTNAGGGNHPGYAQNLTVASHLQARTNRLYPLLSRPINVRNAIFNQNLSEGSILLEVGSDANTLEEALRAVRLFGRSFAETVIRGE